MAKFRVGLVGCGRWGSNLLRNFGSCGDFEVVWVADSAATNFGLWREQYPAVKLLRSAEEALDKYPVEVMVIATPLSTHYKLAKLALSHKCHIFIEKPLASTGDEAQELVAEAEKLQRLLLVDFTYLFHPDIELLCQKVREGFLGDKLLYYDSTRVNWGPARCDASAIEDLAVHDLAILQCLTPLQPEAVSASGIAHIPGQPVDQAFVNLYYPGNFVAHINVNWYAPTKVRRILVGGNRRSADYNELNSPYRLQVHECALPEPNTVEAQDWRQSEKRVWVPELSKAEPLRQAVETFAAYLRRGELARENNALSLRVSRILEVAAQSLQRGGCAVELK